MKRRGLKLVVLSRCSKTLAWSFNNGGSESPKVLCPKSIREYSLHVCVRAAAGNAKDSWLRSPRVSWDRCNLVLFLQLSSSAPMLQRHVARYPS
ncbi:hypothetical protein V6N11_048082 [Hibiscus sabdariffa]|uniref:Secreted protein n=1 Tax=Hibiscus sabdariffa TaxID=183260 RepID=A0ABR2NS55_9ROSI